MKLTRREIIESKGNHFLRSLRLLFSKQIFDKKKELFYEACKKSELTSMGTAAEAKRERSHTHGVYKVAEL